MRYITDCIPVLKEVVQDVVARNYLQLTIRGSIKDPTWTQSPITAEELELAFKNYPHEVTEPPDEEYRRSLYEVVEDYEDLSQTELDQAILDENSEWLAGGVEIDLWDKETSARSDLTLSIELVVTTSDIIPVIQSLHVL